jgi:hypothetical protein
MAAYFETVVERKRLSNCESDWSEKLRLAVFRQQALRMLQQQPLSVTTAAFIKVSVRVIDTGSARRGRRQPQLL